MKFSSFLLIAWFSAFSQSGALATLDGKIFPVFSDRSDVQRINKLKASVNVEFSRNCRVIKAYKLNKIDSRVLIKNEITIDIKPNEGLPSYNILLSGIHLMDDLENIYIETRCHSLWNTITKI